MSGLLGGHTSGVKPRFLYHSSSVYQKLPKHSAEAVWQSYCKNKRVQFFCHTVYTSYTAQPVAQYTTCTLSLIHLNIFLSHISNCNITSCAKQPKARGPSTQSQCSPIKMNTGIDAVAIMQMLTADDMNIKSKSKYKRRGSHSECQNCNNSYDRNLCCPVIQYVQLQWSC